MLPLVFTPGTHALLAGEGPAWEKRRALLEAAGIRRLTIVHGRPEERLLEGQRLVFGAGLSEADGEWLAATARARGLVVNIEDVPHLCDVHVPALVRRGELLLTASTGGGAPALAAALREWLAVAFDESWEKRLAELAALRGRLRAEGLPPPSVLAALRAHLDASGWLPRLADRDHLDA